MAVRHTQHWGTCRGMDFVLVIRVEYSPAVYGDLVIRLNINVDHDLSI